MHELSQMIKDDMKPALGVTEPGALAFAVAKAKSYTKGTVREGYSIHEQRNVQERLHMRDPRNN